MCIQCILSTEIKEIVRDNVSSKQYKMFALEATKSQQLLLPQYHRASGYI